jgi:uncharacterized protein involved in high-affinity Fe2+ transport
MKHRTIARKLAIGMSLVALSLFAALSFVACGTDTDAGAAAPGVEAGFEEFPIGDDQVVGPLNVAGVYFQPVDMEPAGSSLPKAQSDIHIEADISAAENDLGYGVGDFVPNLTVSYELYDETGAQLLQEGAFMPMNATDGPHYGANVKLPNEGAATYVIRFIIGSPEQQDFLLHTDAETGVEGSFWTTPLEVEWTWDYVPHEW